MSVILTTCELECFIEHLRDRPDVWMQVTETAWVHQLNGEAKYCFQAEGEGALVKLTASTLSDWSQQACEASLERTCKNWTPLLLRETLFLQYVQEGLPPSTAHKLSVLAQFALWACDPLLSPLEHVPIKPPEQISRTWLLTGNGGGYVKLHLKNGLLHCQLSVAGAAGGFDCRPLRGTLRAEHGGVDALVSIFQQYEEQPWNIDSTGARQADLLTESEPDNANLPSESH